MSALKPRDRRPKTPDTRPDSKGSTVWLRGAHHRSGAGRGARGGRRYGGYDDDDCWDFHMPFYKVPTPQKNGSKKSARENTGN